MPVAQGEGIYENDDDKNAIRLEGDTRRMNLRTPGTDTYPFILVHSGIPVWRLQMRLKSMPAPVWITPLLVMVIPTYRIKPLKGGVDEDDFEI